MTHTGKLSLFVLNGQGVAIFRDDLVGPSIYNPVNDSEDESEVKHTLVYHTITAPS